MRTKFGVTEEIQRVAMLKDQKSLFADTQVATTQFLKKCIVVSKKDGMDLGMDIAASGGMMNTSPELGLENAMSGGAGIKPQNPFQRGAMIFDDYNYNQHNSYILIKKPEKGERVDKDDVGARVEFSSTILEGMTMPDYEHQTIQSVPVSPTNAEVAVPLTEEEDKASKKKKKQ